MGIASMTGFAAASATDGAESVQVELRSVNGKFCEVKARLPRELAALETDAVKRIKERLSRGTVDLSVRRTTAAGGAAPRVNAAALQALAQSAREAAAQAGLSGDAAAVSLGQLLLVPGVVAVEESAADVSSLGRALLTAVDAALDGMQAVRRREGAALEADLRGRLGRMRSVVDEVERLVPASVESFRARLEARLAELPPDVMVDPSRLAQEVLFFADRIDVTEELVRLRAHFEAFDALLSREGPVGRPLEFLLQELGREVNTTGSKNQSVEVAQRVVELKTELERLREQVANVE